MKEDRRDFIPPFKKRGGNERKPYLKKGFTLIEMIVVTTIFSLVGLGIISCFISGMKIWDRARHINRVRGNVLLTMEMMARELRQSVNTERVTFEGKERSVSFPTRTGHTISRVTYLFKSLHKGIFRQQLSLRDVVEEHEKAYQERKTLSADNFFLEYLYFDKDDEVYLWTDEWDEEDGIFSAVRLTIEADGEEFSKTVFIPVGGVKDEG